MPRVHMPAEHDDFVFQIGPGNFGNRVVAHVVLILIFNLQVNCHLQLFALLHHAHHAVVLLDRNRHLRDHFRFRLRVVIRKTRQRAHLLNALGYRLGDGSLLDKNSSARAARTYIDQHRGAFVDNHVHPL